MASNTIEPAVWQVLFVIHRCSEGSRLAALAAPRADQQILVLSTHRPFPVERAALAASLEPARVKFLCFADLLTDAIMAALDDETTAELRDQRVPAATYAGAFQALMTRKKNACVRLRLPRLAPDARLFADDGLGVDWTLWREQGARPLFRRSWRERIGRHPLRRAVAAWRQSRRLPSTGIQLGEHPTHYLFASGVRRLPLAAGAQPVTVPFDHSHRAQADFVAITIHEPWPGIARAGRPVRIFADGYLPSNYPRTYLDSFCHGEFVAADPFSARWLERHGRRVAPTPAFLAPPAWAPLPTAPVLRTVVGLLNHAGDWSALINRSDTDVLATVFAELATAYPGTAFVLRPHPGMDRPEHEGAGGVQRLAEFVRQTGLSNLTCSTGPLEADLARGDIFLSEYSATLLDAWRSGKAGLIVNLTNRRSFMEDFAQIGFVQVDTVSALRETLDRLRSHPGEFLEAHNAAVCRYNELLTAHLRR